MSAMNESRLLFKTSQHTQQALFAHCKKKYKRWIAVAHVNLSFEPNIICGSGKQYQDVFKSFMYNILTPTYCMVCVHGIHSVV